MRTEHEIRLKLDEIQNRPAPDNAQVADLYRGRIQALLWVLEENEKNI